MDARFYNSEEIDIERLANDLENVYRMQGYETQQVGNKDQMMVQLKKGGDLVALIGLQAALSVILQHSAGGLRLARERYGRRALAIRYSMLWMDWYTSSTLM